MKRFYKETGVDAGEGGFRVLLDGKPMRTPAKAVLVVPTRALAEAIADEWAAVPEKAEINAAHLPLTRLAATGIDRVVSRRDEVIADTSKYAASDLLCYRAAGPDSLVGLQCERWNPLLAWAEARHGIEFSLAQGVLPIDQPAATVATLRAAVLAHDPFRLAALTPLVTIGGSLVAGLALADDAFPVDALWDAVSLDELYQERRWGADSEAQKARAGHQRDWDNAARFLTLL